MSSYNNNYNNYNNYNRAPSHSPSPSPYPIQSSDMYRQPVTPLRPIDSRPSVNTCASDYPDETKSFASTTHLNAPSKEWGVGQVVPSLPAQYQAQAYPYPPRPAPQAYPSPSPMTSYSGTSHWHAMRNQLLERRVVKQIPLHNGNLIMDVPVPKEVVPTTKGLGLEQEEMDKMRYSAATCDPDDFMASKFSLRQYLYGRKTELFVSSSEIRAPS
jgi:chitin synthase